MAFELSSLERSFLKTLAYFDLFGYPLTLLELSQFCLVEDGSKNFGLPGEMLRAYEQSDYLKSKISFERGFFYFRGKDGLIARRQQRYNIADQKYKIVARALKMMKMLPSVRAGMICNSLSFNNSSEQSDIDLFLIIHPKTIWVTRFLLIVISEILGVRIHVNQTQDKICLSFFTCVGNYDFSKITVSGQDVYLQYWLATLAPVFGDGEYQSFIHENSALMKVFPNFRPKKVSGRRSLRRAAAPGSLKIIFPLLRVFDVLAKKIQLAKMAPHKLALAQAFGSEIVLSDQMLKFHDNDRRWLYQQQYERLCQELIGQ